MTEYSHPMRTTSRKTVRKKNNNKGGKPARMKITIKKIAQFEKKKHVEEEGRRDCGRDPANFYDFNRMSSLYISDSSLGHLDMGLAQSSSRLKSNNSPKLQTPFAVILSTSQDFRLIVYCFYPMPDVLYIYFCILLISVFCYVCTA